MKPNKRFQSGCNFAPDYGFLATKPEKLVQYIQDVELIPLRVTGTGSDTDYEHYPEVPNCYGVYLRYSNTGIEFLNLNPSEWIADFSDEQTARAFQNMVITMLTAHMTEEEKERLAFKLVEG